MRAAQRWQARTGRKKRRDANEREIIEALEDDGFEVIQLDKPCDLLVGGRGRTYLMEVKNPHGRNELSDDQQKWIDSWPGSRVHVVRTVQEARDAVRDVHC